ncbi:putative ribonuclease H-like domain-containing protein [Tanacetum coccineum]
MKTPMSSDTKLKKDKECESVDSTKYRGMRGSLLYLTTSIPDIMFSVCLCARFQEDPKTSHLEAWSLDQLASSVPTGGPYQTNPPSPDEIKLYVPVEREDVVTRIRHDQVIDVEENQILTREITPIMKTWVDIIRENVFCLGGNRDHVPACLCHMLYCFASYILYDRVMYPLTAQQERKTREDYGKDYGTKRGRPSTSATFCPPSVNHPPLITSMTIMMEMTKIKLTIIPPRKLFVELTQKDDDTTTPSPITKSSSASLPNAPSKTPTTKDTSSTFGTTSSSFESKSHSLPPSYTPSPQPTNPFLDDILDAPLRPSNQLPLQSYLLEINHYSPCHQLLSLITHLMTPSPPSPPPPQLPIMGHLIYFNMFDYHGMSVPVTAEEKTNKKNDAKARILLLMALPNEHQLTFSVNTLMQNNVGRSQNTFRGSKNIVSSTNDVNTANPAYDVSTVSPNINTACPQDLEQIHKDDLEAMDLKWQLSLLTPRAWYETLSTYLLDNGFHRGQIDKTLFIKRLKGDILLVQVYVDDIIFGSTKKSLCDEFEQIMHNRFQMSSMGELTFFLGLQVKQKEDGIFISQDKYVGEILKKFGFSSLRTASTPMETNKALTKDEDGEDVDVHLYRSMIGSLMYLTSSRPDIMFSVCACSRFQVQPKVSHLNAVKRIFRYLKGQPKLGLWYPKDSPLILEAFSDSDYAGASLDRKSTTGGCQFLGSRLISWQCKKQTVVANSTTEAEYIAASHCCGQVLWIQNQMLDYGYNFMQTKIHVDNESAICVIKNPVYHSKTKHIEIRHHFIRDSYEKRLIEMVKIHIDHNIADLLTKSFDVSRFNFLVASIGEANYVNMQSRMVGRTCNIKRGRDTKIPQSGGPPIKVGDEAVHKELGDRMERAATTASSLEAEQDSDAQTRFEAASE